MLLGKKASLLASAVAALILQTILNMPATAQNNAGPQAGTGSGNATLYGNGRRARARMNVGGPKQSPVGPAWKRGQDNAQNPQRLKRAMKVQERRQNFQYKQAMSQVKEQQQQDYEKQMLQKLGSQRPAIQQNREDLKHVRQVTGANN